MNFTTDYRLENFILQTQWADIPAPVQERLRGCMLDLLGALVAGSGSGQFAAGLALARRAFRSGDIAVIGAADTFDFLGPPLPWGTPPTPMTSMTAITSSVPTPAPPLSAVCWRQAMSVI